VKHQRDNQFALTYRAVIGVNSIQQYSRTSFFFQPDTERGFKNVYGHPKPRYSEQIESGVFCFVAPANTHGKKYGIQSGNKSTMATMEICTVYDLKRKGQS